MATVSCEIQEKFDEVVEYWIRYVYFLFKNVKFTDVC